MDAVARGWESQAPGVALPATAAARRGVRLTPAAGLTPFAGLQIFAFWIPMALFLGFAFTGAGAPWADFLASGAKIDSVKRTLWISAEVTIVCAALAYVYVGALLLASKLWRMVLLLCVVVPFLTSIVVRTYAWIIVLGPSGPINAALRGAFGPQAAVDLVYNRAGVLIGMVHVLLPLFILPLYAVSAQLPPNLNRAARTMGANRVAAWFAVDARLNLSGAAAGAALVFIQALGFFVTPAMLGGLGDTMIAQFIERDMRSSVDLGAAAALSLVLVAAVGLCVVVFRLFYPLESLFIRQASGEEAAHAAGDRPPAARWFPQRLADPANRLWLAATEFASRLPWTGVIRVGGALIAGFFLLPLIVVVPVSLTGDEFLQFPPQAYDGRWYPRVLLDPDWRLAIANSFLTGAIAVFVTLCAALPLSFVIVRSSLSQGLRGALVGLLLVPAIVPTIVLAVGVYVWFLDAKLVANLGALSLAHSVLGLPFAALILVSALRDLDLRLEQAARSLGAGRWRTLALVTMPLLLAPLASGALLAFLTSFDELLIARAVTNFSTVTLPVKLWNGANEEISPALAVVSVISMLVTVTGAALLSALYRWAQKRRRETT